MSHPNKNKESKANSIQVEAEIQELAKSAMIAQEKMDKLMLERWQPVPAPLIKPKN